MSHSLRARFVAISILAATSLLNPATPAQSVWSGFSYSFNKAAFGDPTLPANQDRLTSNVWLSRGNNQGLFNVHDETGYVAPNSPAGTLWATDINNPGKTIAAANWADLSFTNWIAAYGGQGTAGLPENLLSRNAVLYLVADNAYLDLQFTSWSDRGGGGFAYDRAPSPPPPPTTGDYNHSGFVDAADYVAWRDTLGQAVSPAGSGADGNLSGTIDTGDYNFWRARFGNAVGSGLGAAIVPEPATGASLIGPLTLVVLRRWRARRG